MSPLQPITAEELLSRSFPPITSRMTSGRVRVYRRGIELTITPKQRFGSGCTYFIEAAELKSKGAARKWLLQLSEQTWTTPEMLGDLVLALIHAKALSWEAGS